MPASAGCWPSNGYSAIGPVLLADVELKKQLLGESKTDMKFIEAKEQQNDSTDRVLPSLIDYIALFLWLGWLHVFCITIFFAVITGIAAGWFAFARVGGGADDLLYARVAASGGKGCHDV